MKSWLMGVVATLGSLFHSKKFQVAAGGVATAIANGVAPGTAILVGAGSYVIGQGMADWGKNAVPPKP